MNNEEQKQEPVRQSTQPRTKEMQETINHLILGITMWISTSVTCLTTLLSVHQPWCLFALILPFVYTMFPQIQKLTTSIQESAYTKYKVRKELKFEKQAAKLADIQEKQNTAQDKKEKKTSKMPVSLEANQTEKVEVQL